MATDVRYVFKKSYYYLHGRDIEQIIVQAKLPNGATYTYQPPQGEGTARDYKNNSNMLANLDEYLERRVKGLNFKSTTTVKEALSQIQKYIDQKDLYAEFDTGVYKDVVAEEAFSKRLREAGIYQNILANLIRFNPAGIRAIITGEKYPIRAAIHDMSHGGSRKEVLDLIAQLSDETREILQKEIKKQNYEITPTVANRLSREYFTKVIETTPKIDNSKERMSNMYARAADDALYDALAYKYYKTTTDEDIFLTTLEQKKIDKLSDAELVEQFGPDMSQRFANAMQIIHRIKQLEEKKQPTTSLFKELNKVSFGYFNQEIIKMFFDALKDTHNRFKYDKESFKFITKLAYYIKDDNMLRKFVETFGFDKYIAQQINQEMMQDLKKEHTETLKKAAKRLQGGDYISDIAVIDRKRKILDEYNVAETPETHTTIKSKIPLSKTQKKIIERFGEMQK